ncbi:MATE family efflux transporter [uncultured Limosilactobacillus sp.]|uniref:MATE family efflux transporter n=1 Tax=uncultured Limosilactobacillus sp. TaxID=2837629 RepID=UPI0025E2A686|nr:MATE family efflux transporter [uncultured Limosilactobacillus sp.]
MNNDTLDLTTGKPLIRILQFSTPLIFGTLFQQLYSFVDSIIVGHFISANALGAVGATYSLNFLIIGFVQSFCVGLGIPIAQSFGAHQKRDLQNYFWNGFYLSILISIFFSVLMTIFTQPMLTMMKTPQPLLHDAVVFIKPQFLFIWVTVLYNFSASVLRSLGDSKTPFYTLVLASLLNIVIDILLIGEFHWGVIGAAVATIVAQTISGLMNVIWLVKTSSIINFTHPQLKFSVKHTCRLAYIAFPMGIEYSISAIGAIIMQFAINSLGTIYVVSQTAGEKIRQMFTLPIESVGMGMSTFIGQNFGAHSMKRIRQGLKDGMKIQIVYYGCCLVIIMLFANQLSRLVIGNHPELIYLSSLYLRLMSCTFFLHGTLMIYRYTLQGLGFSLQAIWAGVNELIGRSVVSIIAISLNSFIAVCFINPVAWGLAGGYCCWMVYHQLKKISFPFTRQTDLG